MKRRRESVARSYVIDFYAPAYYSGLGRGKAVVYGFGERTERQTANLQGRRHWCRVRLLTRVYDDLGVSICSGAYRPLLCATICAGGPLCHWPPGTAVDFQHLFVL